MRAVLFIPSAYLTSFVIIQLRNKTAGAAWYDLPAPPPEDLPRLQKEVEALRLHSQMDPKRFYRKDDGEGKGIKGLPKHFAVSIPHHEPSEQSILTVLPIFFRLAQLLPSQRPSVLPVGRTSQEANGNERLWMNSWMMRRRRVMPKRSSKSCRRSGVPRVGIHSKPSWRNGNRGGDSFPSVSKYIYPILFISISPIFEFTNIFTAHMK